MSIFLKLSQTHADQKMGQLFSKTNEVQKKQIPLGQEIEFNTVKSDPSLSTPEPKKFIDPRSPTICRTPINDLGTPSTPSIAATKRLNLTTDAENLSTPPNRLIGTQKNFLQEKLLKNLGYQSFDPRSPTQFINRTPIKWEENEQKTEDSLINDSVQAVEHPEPEQIPDEVANDSVESLEDPDTSIDKFIAELEIDPRSPSINVERTPIVFKQELVLDDSIELPSENIENRSTPMKHSIYQDEADAHTPATPKVEPTTLIPSNNQRTPLSCLANKGRPSVLQQSNNNKNKPKHPILFIGQQQQTPKCIKNGGGGGGGTPFGNSNNNNKFGKVSTKIPVFKNTIL